MSRALDDVLRGVRAFAGVTEGRKRPGGGGTAFSSAGREFLHVHGPTRIDVRVGKSLARAFGPDVRVVARASASDWVEVRVEARSDVSPAIDLARRAQRASRRSSRSSA